MTPCIRCERFRVLPDSVSALSQPLSCIPYLNNTAVTTCTSQDVHNRVDALLSCPVSARAFALFRFCVVCWRRQSFRVMASCPVEAAYLSNGTLRRNPTIHSDRCESNRLHLAVITRNCDLPVLMLGMRCVCSCSVRPFDCVLFCPVFDPSSIIFPGHWTPRDQPTDNHEQRNLHICMEQ